MVWVGLRVGVRIQVVGVVRVVWVVGSSRDNVGEGLGIEVVDVVRTVGAVGIMVG